MRRLSLFALALLAGCGASQTAAVDAAIAANASKLTVICNTDVLPYLNGLPGTIVEGLVPIAAQGAQALRNACSAIPTVAASLSTAAWIATELTVIKSNGTVLPAPVAPVSIAAAMAVGSPVTVTAP